MKFKFFISIFLLGLLCISAYKKADPGSVIIQTRFNNRLVDLKQDLQTLLNLAQQKKQTKEHQKTLREHYLKLRQSYKAWEYLADWLDPYFIKEQINAAPLPKLEQNSFGLNIIQAQGMQVIDEIVFDDSLLYKSDVLSAEINKTIIALRDYTNYKIYDADVFIANRMSLIRMFAISASGFDAPGSLASLNDLIQVSTVMLQDLQVYQNDISAKNPSLSDSIYSTLHAQIQFLKQQKNFNDLDRYTYLKNYINPLFSLLLSAHQTLEIEMPSEIKVRKMAINYLARDLFSIDLFNDQYYLDVPMQFRNSKSVELGKLLFFDPILSENNQRACASCHKPELAFTDGREKSEAFDHRGQIRRNSPTLWNSVLSEKYFHDLRAKDLSEQIEHVIISSGEFNTSWEVILDKLNSSSAYKTLFAEAFNLKQNDLITAIYIRYAIAAYVAELKGFNSRFDQLLKSDLILSRADKQIVNGFNLFMGKAACATCHFVPAFNGTVAPWYVDSESEVLGVPEKDMKRNAQIDPDLGRGSAILKEQVNFYRHSFKTPGLRNIALTAPYMHNGVFKDLKSVMDFYNRGGGAGIGIQLEHQTLSSEPLNLSKKEIADIIVFMESLSDTMPLDSKPLALPKLEKFPELNNRVIGGVY